jgi:hypothetical protein
MGVLRRFQASHPDIPVLQKPFGMGTLLEQMKMLALLLLMSRARGRNMRVRA